MVTLADNCLCSLLFLWSRTVSVDYQASIRLCACQPVWMPTRHLQYRVTPFRTSGFVGWFTDVCWR
ncbi:hypothetical protein PR001_g28857 [Phytophthora rubi]|uniref:Secreted protein n=1 Tax=Phytophthora rubi TaxID=129364 RepID=A0A6A3GIH3_9STRA|nr:hypothetical protein PR002_g31394 [Phytophthora rubi]KAE8965009.1 hypothetical protein PR001_g28857 [Phytophthora rubi]